jgi:hypothetical protein
MLWFGIKVLELLEILQFQLPESHSEFPPELHALKEELKVCVFFWFQFSVLVNFRK